MITERKKRQCNEVSGKLGVPTSSKLAVEEPITDSSSPTLSSSSARSWGSTRLSALLPAGVDSVGMASEGPSLPPSITALTNFPLPVLVSLIFSRRPRTSTRPRKSSPGSMPESCSMANRGLVGSEMSLSSAESSACNVWSRYGKGGGPRIGDSGGSDEVGEGGYA